MKELSVIVPCFNEEGNLNLFNKTLITELKSIEYEVIYVDDGSSDETFNILKVLAKKDKHIKIIRFSRNFNKDSAIFAGLENCNAKYTCIIDADMQQHPKYITKMYNFLEENNDYDQVAMVNKKRKEKKLTIFFKKCFYKVIDKLSDIKFVDGASDFRMLRCNVIKEILKLNERNRFSKGIFSWIGFNTYYMEYDVLERNNGESKFKLKANLKYALDGIISFSTKPLRIATFIGLISSFIAFVLLIEVLIEKIFWNTPIAGYPTIMCAILFIGGIQLITIGILGEYLAKTYIETKKRPIYIVKEKYGFKD